MVRKWIKVLSALPWRLSSLQPPAISSKSRIVFIDSLWEEESALLVGWLCGLGKIRSQSLQAWSPGAAVAFWECCLASMKLAKAAVSKMTCSMHSKKPRQVSSITIELSIPWPSTQLHWPTTWSNDRSVGSIQPRYPSCAFLSETWWESWLQVGPASSAPT